jgi:hypothetical protein
VTVDARLAIDKDRHEAVLHERRQRGRKRHRRSDDLIAAPKAVLDLRAEQRRDHEQVRRGTRIDEVGRVGAEIVAHLLLELVRKGAGGEPEIEDAFGAKAQFLVIINAPGVGNFALAGDKRLRRVGHLVVAGDEAQDFLAELGGGSVGGIHGAG